MSEKEDDLIEEVSVMDQAMAAEDQQEGTFLTGGNKRAEVELEVEREIDEDVILNPKAVIDGKPLMDFLRKNLHKFDSPYAYIGGEANSPDISKFHTSELKILVARLSSYEAVSLSMTHSLMSQIYGELDFVFTDLAFAPKPDDYKMLKSHGFPVWFGTNTKLAPREFDILSISHAVSMEQLNFVPLLHDSGIPLFKQQRMEREDIPIIVMGGANSGTSSPLNGDYVTSDGTVYSCMIDAVIYGDGEEAAKIFATQVYEGKKAGLSKKEILRSCHGVVPGFYEPDQYEHKYDGEGVLLSVKPKVDYVEFPVKRATVKDLDTVRTLEEKILPYTGDGASVDVAIAGSVGCIGSAGWGSCSFCREGSEGPYRERSLDKVMTALYNATRNQGTKEVSFFCFAEDQMVMTQEGLKEISKVQSHDLVADYEGLSPIRSSEARAVQKTVSILTKYGQELRVTPEHKVQVWAEKYPFHQFKMAQDIQVGDRLVGKLGGYEGVEGTEFGQSIGQRDAELLGLICGDGYKVNTGDCVRLYVAKEDTLNEYIADYCREVCGNSQFTERDDGTNVYGWTEWVWSGQVRKEGVPDVILQSPPDTAAAFLRGLFEADGSANTKAGAVYLSTKHLQTSRVVALMLRHLGIASRSTKIEGVNPFNGELRIYYEVHVVGGRAKRRFADLVGFITDRKQEALLGMLEGQDRSESFALPKVVREVLRNMKEAHKELYGDVPSLWKKRASTFTLNDDDVSMATVREVVGSSATQTVDSERLLAFLQQDLTLEEVVSIQENAPEPTWDVVDSRHGMILAQGFVVSQSLNFNQYTDLFPLVQTSVQRGYKVGLISQRIDMLAETPEQIEVQRWLKKSNFTLGVEGISSRIRAFLNKNTQEWEILKVAKEMMVNGAGELKFFYILCLPAGERVWTNKGMVPIETMCSDVVFPPLEGEKIPGLPGEVASVVRNDGVTVWGGDERPAEKWVTKSATQIVRVVNDLGQSVRMAANHWVRTQSGWKKAGDLTSEDFIEVAIGGMFGDSKELTASKARVLGQAIGDGGANGEGRGFYVAFNYDDPEEISYLRNNGNRSRWLTSVSGKQMYFAEYDAKQWVHAVEGNAWTKKVPEVVFRSPAKVVAAWLEGYFQADGAIDANGYPRWCSRSGQLLSEVQQLLLALGVVSRLKKYETTNGEQWHLTVRGEFVPLFKELMGGCPKAKRIRNSATYEAGERNKFSQVVSVILDGTEPVYSPMVQHEDETYYASGMVHHNTNMETEVDIEEHNAFMEKVNAIREKLGAKTRFRLSFTPLFPSAFTALQFAPCLAAMRFGEKNLNRTFEKARDLGWGRRLSVSGEEPLVSNTINHGGRNITPLLISSWFQDGYMFYGNVPKGTWERWQRRIDLNPNINTDLIWGEKSYQYIFPWEDIAYSTSKEVLWRGYLKATAFQGVPYCLTTPTIKGQCTVNECGCCDPDKTGKPDPKIIKMIVGRKVAPAIPVREIEKIARSREKAYHLRVLADVKDPIYRFVEKNYFSHVIARAFMKSSDKFTDVFVGAIGHARIGASVNMQRDWVYGQNIYDFSLSELMPESEIKALIGPANSFFKEGEILGARMETHLSSLRSDVDFAIYSAFLPASDMSYKKLRDLVAKFFERQTMGRTNAIRIKKAVGKDIFRMVEKELSSQEIRQVQVEFVPEMRGTVMRMVVAANYNVLSMLEAITGQRAFRFKKFPIHCDGYMQLSEVTGEVDVFAALMGAVSTCSECGGPLETNLFTGEKHHSGICMSCNIENYPLDMATFTTKLMQAA